MTKHPVDVAFVDPTTADQIKQSLALAFPLVLEAADDLPDMDLTGLVVREVRVYGIAFLYDPDDETSEHDGVTTLVSLDGQRFKSEPSPGAFINVLSIVNAPSGGEAVGDKYIVGPAPSGDFAANADDLAVLTSRGWEFAAPEIGQRVYVRALDEYQYWSEAGVWTQDGVADSSLGARKLQFPFGMAVESETDTPPVGTPAEGTKWIVAANATGAWVAWDGDVAEADGVGGFRRLSAYDGATVADRSLKTLRSFNGNTGEWVSSGGAWIAQKSYFEAGDSPGASNAGSGHYGYSTTVPPSTHQRRIQAVLSHQARSAGATLRVTFSASLQRQNGGGGAGTSPDMAVALYRDSETNAIAWALIAPGLGSLTYDTDWCNVTFYITAPDAAAHTYTIAITSAGFNNTEVRALASRRLMTIEEAA